MGAACETITTIGFKGELKHQCGFCNNSSLSLMNSKRAFICALNDENFNPMLRNCVRCWNSIRFCTEKIIRRRNVRLRLEWVLIRREVKIFRHCSEFAGEKKN
ncbi:hypothetical protein CEXT_448071 [Caerostris extrusa]|uniref:Uncharacterized protein n=1 Tax=Caerostris extrusa TaxID=172846 RepID=A0AAV4PF74_CAEEX|nr:hypothetical protein CEXT_448071 [Caerostris extrusa]